MLIGTDYSRWRSVGGIKWTTIHQVGDCWFIESPFHSFQPGKEVVWGLKIRGGAYPQFRHSSVTPLNVIDFMTSYRFMTKFLLLDDWSLRDTEAVRGDRNEENRPAGCLRPRCLGDMVLQLWASNLKRNMQGIVAIHPPPIIRSNHRLQQTLKHMTRFVLTFGERAVTHFAPNVLSLIPFLMRPIVRSLGH